VTSQENFSLPPLDVDGRVDLLTGLDAPEIFYRFLAKAISSSLRDRSHRIVLVRVRLGLEPLSHSSISVTEGSLAFRVVQFAGFLQSQTRSDEHVVRIGEVTFLILAKVRNQGEATSMVSRLLRSLADAKFDRDGDSGSVDDRSLVEREYVERSDDQRVKVDISGYPFEILVDLFLHNEGEEML
jgi:hypothetical protein